MNFLIAKYYVELENDCFKIDFVFEISPQYIV